MIAIEVTPEEQQLIQNFRLVHPEMQRSLSALVASIAADPETAEALHLVH